MTEESTPSVPVEKLVKVYLKMGNALSGLQKEFEERETALKNQMVEVKKALLEYCKVQNVESVRTTEGLFYRSVKTRYWTGDWESMGKFIIEHHAPELLEKRIHQGNFKQFHNPDDGLPPGVNVMREYGITVRKPSN